MIVSVHDGPTVVGKGGGISLDATDDVSARSNGLLGLVERIEKLHESYPPDLWDGVPPDSAKNFKHYLYGHPKVED